MNTQHTPGPWYVDTQGKRADYIRASGDELPGTCAIAQMCSRGGWSEATANARLIAAAPELLAVLQKIAASQFYVSHASVLRAELDAAIAKATKGQP